MTNLKKNLFYIKLHMQQVLQFSSFIASLELYKVEHVFDWLPDAPKISVTGSVQAGDIQ